MWHDYAPPHEVSVAIRCCSVLSLCVCLPVQTGPHALDGVVSASSRLHPAGGPVQTHEGWHQAADQWAAALPERSHLEAQLCGTIRRVNTKSSGANKGAMNHLSILSSFLLAVSAFLSSTDTIVSLFTLFYTIFTSLEAPENSYLKLFSEPVEIQIKRLLRNSQQQKKYCIHRTFRKV